MIVLGLDAASHTGWGLIERVGGREKCLGSGVVNGKSWEEVDALASRVVHGDNPPDLVAIEDNFLGVDPNAMKVISRIVGRWLQAFEPLGIDAVLVMASTWQAALLKGLMAHRAQRAERKRAAAQWVQANCGVDLKGDEADAVCLACYAARAKAVGKFGPVD